jgi:hydroxymethylpyrimidine/phosphomethylpyrimidine kinase
MKTALSIAGSDCSGGAGVQADLKTFSALGVFGMSAIVSVVAENTSRVLVVRNLEPEIIGAQIDAVFEDIRPDAVKIGMLGEATCMRAVRERLLEWRPANVVIDPVMVAKNGCPLMEPGAADILIREILPLADVLTPNIPEAERLAGMDIISVDDMERAALRLCAMGCRAVVVKGGHLAGEAVDVLFDGTTFRRYKAARVETKNTHGTGCTFSSAIAASLAQGRPLGEAVAEAKTYVTMAIAHALPLGRGNGPTHHFYALYRHGLRAAADA